MTLRLLPIRRSAEFLHDGDLVVGETGEPLAHSLIAEGRLALARSPKLHRPRGPYCLRAACDGCLLRVDGVPNVMACRHPVQGGETVETQNVLGSRQFDLLQATDFMFPHGVDHHRLLAGVRGVSAVVQHVARRIAGLGRLADEPLAVRSAEHSSRDVVIVGGGAAGLSAAATLGARALLVDDAAELGGALLLLEPARAAKLVEAARAAGAELRRETTALGVYRSANAAPGFGVLLSGPRGAAFVHARSLILATGGHDRAPSFAGNDLPGVFSARAGLALLAGGILPGRKVALVGRGRFSDRVRTALGDRVALMLDSAERVASAEGRQRLSALRPKDAPRRTKVDALLFDAPEAPAFELAVQAGGHSRFVPSLGYVPELDAQGRAAPGVFCAGRVTGGPNEAGEQGRSVASAVAAELGQG
jgi:sarcosine oxidase subunit alpha